VLLNCTGKDKSRGLRWKGSEGFTWSLKRLMARAFYVDINIQSAIE
jgi:hypothetical protein